VLRFDVSPAVSQPSNSILIDVEVEYFRDVNASVPAKVRFSASVASTQTKRPSSDPIPFASIFQKLKGIIVLELSDSQRHVIRHTEKWDSTPVASPVDDISLASQLPRRMSVTQRHADASYYS
jgi:hypothetical protein